MLVEILGEVALPLYDYFICVSMRPPGQVQVGLRLFERVVSATLIIN